MDRTEHKGKQTDRQTGCGPDFFLNSVIELETIELSPIRSFCYFIAGTSFSRKRNSPFVLTSSLSAILFSFL